MHKKKLILFVGLIILVFLIAKCSSPSDKIPQNSDTVPIEVAKVDSCTTKECFISSANTCNDIIITLTEDAGVIKYSSSKDCVFTKTLVSLNTDETQEMKTLLEGKSFTCKYESGNFDNRWVTSLIFGTEVCEGELKNILVSLINFM